MTIIWDRRVRSVITVVTFVILFLLVIRHSGSSDATVTAAGSPFSVDLLPNLAQNRVPDDTGQNRLRTHGAHGSKIARHLLGIREEEGYVQSRATFRLLQEDGLLKINGRQDSGLPSRNESFLGTSACAPAREHKGQNSSCAYVKSIAQCGSGTLIEYTQIFYCFFSGRSVLAYWSLFLWLVVLFYALGNTAADFFCPSIEKLAKLLHLPGTVAGVTLLPLGNGAPDVFASIAAFVGASGQGQVGLNSVLGGATFVSSVVAGSVSLMIVGSGKVVPLDRRCFLRDIGFFLFTLTALITILFIGRVHLWWALAYLCIYAIYACMVFAVEFFKSHRTSRCSHALQPLLSGFQSCDDELEFDRRESYMEIFDNPRNVSVAEGNLPQWMWAPHVAIYHLDRQPSDVRQLWGREPEPEDVKPFRQFCVTTLQLPLTIVQLLLTIPRRLTIPSMEEDGWSKFYAVSSATLAPTLLALVWDGKDGGSIGSAWREYVMAAGFGLILGVTAVVTLRSDRPPRKFLFPWAAGGFIMSIVWFYIIANELVAALVALGVVLQIDASILGLTVLAWGNSIGDLISNLALVSHGVSHGGDQIQTAFSGCYAGPMFNTLVGVGLSFVFASWKTYPNAFSIPEDETIFLTMFFLIVGLIWALYMLLSRDMQPTKTFGFGLLGLYGCFLTLRLAYELGLTPALLLFERT